MLSSTAQAADLWRWGMSNISNEQIQQILDGAPEDEQHVNIPVAGGVTHKVHRLDDLREILTLRQQVQELEEERDEAVHKFTVIADKHGEPDSYKCAVYDLEPAETDKAIRDKLKALGWVPPEEANELAATVERIKQLADKPVKSTTDKWVYEFDAHLLDGVFMSTPATNLNAVKRSAIESAVKGVGTAVYNPPDDPHCCAVAHNDALASVVAFANQRYPDKE